MKRIFDSIKLILPALILTTSFASAQKLPGVQKTSIYAPQNIKIDGKSTDWGDTFQAYNKAVDVFYTISNDDKNIYLLVRAKYKDIIEKIFRGGMTFTINTSPDKKDKVSITYPVLEGPDKWTVINKFAALSNAYSAGEAIKVNELNELFATKEKIATVTGITDFPDESISIYNTDGIKPVSLFDDKLNYTYELALPIAYLKLPNNGGSSFKYQIKINEPLAGQTSSELFPPPVPISAVATTDFWGVYKLAKKP